MMDDIDGEHRQERGGEGKEKTTNQLKAAWRCVILWTLVLHPPLDSPCLHLNWRTKLKIYSPLHFWSFSGALKGAEAIFWCHDPDIRMKAVAWKNAYMTVPVVLSHNMDKDVCVCVFKVSPRKIYPSAFFKDLSKCLSFLTSF